MPQPPVAADVHQPFDVHRHVSAKVALYRIVAIQNCTDFDNIGFGQIAALHIQVYSGFRKNFLGGCRPDTVNIRKRYLDFFIFGEIYPGNSCHISSSRPWVQAGHGICATLQQLQPPIKRSLLDSLRLSLPLLVARVLANYPHNAFATNDRTFWANFTY